jgi:hypothetical protein
MKKKTYKVVQRRCRRLAVVPEFLLSSGRSIYDIIGFNYPITIFRSPLFSAIGGNDGSAVKHPRVYK